jgi:hypothetical protein
MNQREARRRQQLIENTLAGMKAILIDDKTLLQELDPLQEERFKDLLELGVLKMGVQL